jgi:unsaturated rhamnogalacturonyl hydrolase
MPSLPRSLLWLPASLVFVSTAFAAYDFGPWPAGTSPQEVGQCVTENFIPRPHMPSWDDQTIHYAEVCTWYGALTFAQLAKDAALRDRLIARFEPLLREDKALIPEPNHVDYTVFAAVPLEIYQQNKDPRCLALGEWMAYRQWSEPYSSRIPKIGRAEYAKGFTWQTRLWIDDMYMITMAQAQAYRATGNRLYVDRAAKEMVYYLEQLQKPNGLFYHAPDSAFFWGRGNGWMAAGMAELLRSLPADNPDRPRILQGYHAMMAALLNHQSADGMWRQLIDDPETWPETSSTAMFTFAFITGVKEGWLDAATYGPAAKKAWLALTGYLDTNAAIREVCEGTGAGKSRQYYLDRKRITGDFHGQAPMLWCATALLR